MNKLTAWAANNPLAIALGVVAVIATVYYFGGKTLKAAADVVGGVVSGNNAVTENQTNWDGSTQTAYEGKGVLGTLGAATNSASGGALSSIGESIGGAAADVSDWWDRLLHSDNNPSN